MAYALLGIIALAAFMYKKKKPIILPQPPPGKPPPGKYVAMKRGETWIVTAKVNRDMTRDDWEEMEKSLSKMGGWELISFIVVTNSKRKFGYRIKIGGLNNVPVVSLDVSIKEPFQIMKVFRVK